MTAEVLNFKKALKRRRAEEKAAELALAPSGPTLADVLFEKGSYFDINTCAVDVRAGRMVFEDAEAEAKAKRVFQRYGLELDKYTTSWPSMQGASEGMAWAAREVGLTEYLGHRCTDELREYAEAFREQDLMAVRRLAGPIGLHDKIAKETDRAQRMVNVNEKPRLRTDARENAVVAYLLGMQDPGGLAGSTLEHVQTPLFSLTMEADTLVREVVRGVRADSSKKPCPIMRKHEVLRSQGGAKLARLGLLTLMDCPRPDEAAVLFHHERFAKAMDRSRLKHEWRALLGPFVGFDSNYGLLMESDLEWWRIEQETHGSEWAGLPLATPIADKPGHTKRPASKSHKLKSASVDLESSPSPKAKTRKGLQATLHVKQLLSRTAAKKLQAACDRGSFKDNLPEDIVEGVLKVGEYEFRMSDADTLGTIAFICGVTTVKAVTPSREQVIVMRAKTRNVHEIAPAEKDEKEFLWAFHRAHHAAATASKESTWTIAWWTEKRLAPALKLVPEYLQVNNAFEPGKGI